MRLLDVATVNPQDRWATRWLHGYTGTTRECAVQMEIQQPCPAIPANFDADVVELIGATTSHVAQYNVKTFPVRSYLRGSVMCERDDDQEWFAEAIKSKLDYIASRALVLGTVTGSDTWIGATGVRTVALPATPTPADWRMAISAARHLWVTSVVSRNAHPLLHIPPMLAGEILNSGLLMITGPNQIESIWNDKVVISDGYDDAVTPRVFFSGEVIVRIAGIDGEGAPIYDHRINSFKLEMTQFVSVDAAPCAMVRVGG